VRRFTMRTTPWGLGSQRGFRLQSAQPSVVVAVFTRRKQGADHHPCWAEPFCWERPKRLRRTPPCGRASVSQRDVYDGWLPHFMLKRSALGRFWIARSFLLAPDSLPARGHGRRGRGGRRRGHPFIRLQYCDWGRGGRVDDSRRGSWSRQRRRWRRWKCGANKVAGRHPGSNNLEIQLVADQNVPGESGLLWGVPLSVKRSELCEDVSV
jgi:hypothetical protein